MANIATMWAIALRHIRVLQRDINFLLMYFYWPLLDILTWGFLGSWIGKSHLSGFENYEIIALLGVVLWGVVGRGCNFLVFGFSEELWSHNLINLCSLPLSLAEWIGGLVIFYLIMMSATSFFCIAAAGALYGISLWQFISTFLLFAPPLIIAALWIGFTSLQLLVMFGKRGVEIAFVITWFLMPFSGAYYPISVLPAWGQTFSSLLPISYIFEGMRSYVMYQQDPTIYLLKGYAIAIPYAIIAMAGFVYFFNRSKRKGLARLVE
jgi:ABC-2 type transport system permease protein